jgi:hypothetical protein
VTPEEVNELFDALAKQQRMMAGFKKSFEDLSARLAIIERAVLPPTAAGDKEGESEMFGKVRAIAKEYPNEYGWFKLVVAPGPTKIGEIWLSTKSRSIAAVAERARDEKWNVRVTFNSKPSGEHTNHYLQTIEKIGDDGSLPEKAPAARGGKAAEPAASVETPF